MKNRLFLLTLAELAAPVFASPYSLELTPQNTKIEWTLSSVLHAVKGTFALKSGHVEFDPQTGTASGRVVVDVLSGDSGNTARDRKMHEKVLESAKYSEAVFVPDRLEGQPAIPGDSTVKLHGSFTLHGATHEMTMDVQEKSTPETMSVTARFDVPYVAWGMKNPSTFILKVSKTVQVVIRTDAPLRQR